MRRAVLEGGRRVAERGQIHEPVHLVDAGFDEMCSLISDGSGPSADDLAARATDRTSRTSKAAPRALGDPPPPPDSSGLPPDAARLMRATGLALGHLFGSSEAEHDEQVLRGLGASPGAYEGPARLISGPSEFDRIANGDVLVTQSTTEAFNILLPLLGATRNRQRRTALTLGDRRTRVRHPRRGRDARSDRPDRRRDARARRR